eukprot:gene56912-biopygen99226
MACIRLLRLVKVPFLFAATNHRAFISGAYVHFRHNALPMINYFFWTCLFVHYSAEAMLYLQKDSNRQYFSYADALYATLMTLSSVGYGDVDMNSESLHAWADVMFVVSMFANESGFICPGK